MKIAVLSDIHEGINRKNSGSDILEAFKKRVLELAPDVLIIGGDLTAGPEKSLRLLKRLEIEMPHIQTLYVHGNHDIYDTDSNRAYKILMEFKGNLGHGPVHLTDQWVVIGEGGWYDYSFGVDGYTEDEFAVGRFNDFIWPDKEYANWMKSDKLVTDRYCAKIEQWLKENQNKNIILVCHFVPFAHFVQVKNEPSWDFFNAMMGSSRLGQLAEKYGVKKIIFGHIHTRFHETINGIECICNPLGYFPHEWKLDSAQEEINATLKLIELAH